MTNRLSATATATGTLTRTKALTTSAGHNWHKSRCMWLHRRPELNLENTARFANMHNIGNKFNTSKKEKHVRSVVGAGAGASKKSFCGGALCGCFSASNYSRQLQPLPVVRHVFGCVYNKSATNNILVAMWGTMELVFALAKAFYISALFHVVAVTNNSGWVSHNKVTVKV